jgi:hypothetical protein
VRDARWASERDRIEPKVDAERRTEADELALCVSKTIHITESLAQVFGAIAPLFRQMWIQFERQPRDLCDGAGSGGEGLL